jgi:hypothetical protein
VKNDTFHLETLKEKEHLKDISGVGDEYYK